MGSMCSCVQDSDKKGNMNLNPERSKEIRKFLNI